MAIYHDLSACVHCNHRPHSTPASRLTVGHSLVGQPEKVKVGYIKGFIFFLFMMGTHVAHFGPISTRLTGDIALCPLKDSIELQVMSHNITGT